MCLFWGFLFLGFFFFAVWLITYINTEHGTQGTRLIKKSNCYTDYRHFSQTLKSIVLRIISNLVYDFRKQLCFSVSSDYYNLYIKERLTWWIFFIFLFAKSTHHHRIYMFAVKKKNNFYCEYSHGLWLKLGWMLPCLPCFPLLHLRQQSNPTFNAKIVSAMSGISCLISSKINSADLFRNYLISGISIQVIYKAWCEKHFHG